MVATPVSPELLPADNDGNINQKTENLVGPAGLSYSTVKKAYEVISCCHRYYRMIYKQTYNPAAGIAIRKPPPVQSYTK